MAVGANFGRWVAFLGLSISDRLVGEGQVTGLRSPGSGLGLVLCPLLWTSERDDVAWAGSFLVVVWSKPVEKRSRTSKARHASLTMPRRLSWLTSCATKFKEGRRQPRYERHRSKKQASNFLLAFALALLADATFVLNLLRPLFEAAGRCV
eukprot:scaffold1085_cov252-Pinguiococcus_pyrenoidosus.AAC.26